MFRKLPPRRGFSTDRSQTPKQTSSEIHSDSKPEFLFAKAIECCSSGEIDSAIKLFSKVISIDPAAYTAHYNIAKAYFQSDQADLAIHHFEQTLSLCPQQPNAWISYASALKVQDRTSEACVALEKALELKPLHPGALYNMGLLLVQEYRYDDAINWFSKAIEQDPSFTDSLYNLALCYQKLNHPDKSIRVLRKALTIRPNDASLSKFLALSLLTKGCFGEAWPLYESRFYDTELDRVIPYHEPDLPRLTSSCISNQDLRCIIVSEQGLGDTIQFVRFIPQFMRIMPNSSFCCPSLLHPLLELGIDSIQLHDVDSVTTSEYDRWVPLMSLPLLLGIDHTSKICSLPYLSFPVSGSFAITASTTMLKVGIHWQGSSKYEKGILSVGRSYPLELFSPIAQIPNLKLISLQIGPGTEQLNECSFLDCFLLDPQTNLDRSLLETSQLIELCDLVITNDTSIAHLSGALGRSTYLLVQKSADWRWGQYGESSYWYDAITILRQSSNGNWTNVFNDVYNKITGMMESRHSKY